MEVMAHFDNGGKVEAISLRTQNNDWVINSNPFWNWVNCDYRIEEETPIDWLKTGWVKNKDTGIEWPLAGYDKSEAAYYVSRECYNESEMPSYFDPCNSPIGK